MKKEKSLDLMREWICGVGYALAEVQRLHDQPTVVNDVAHATGLSFKDFKSAGLSSFDLKTLRKVLVRRKTKGESS